MSFDNFDFNVDIDSMAQDLGRVDSKPGQKTTTFSKKYVQLPKGEGALTVRILPPNRALNCTLPYASTRLHYLNGVGYHCMRELDNGRWLSTAGGDCPICNYYNFLYRQADNMPKEEADRLKRFASQFKPIERYSYNVIVRKMIDGETGEAIFNVGPLILQVGKSLHGRILRAFVGNRKLDEKPLGNVAHPFTGRDFKIIKEIRKSDGQEFPNYDSSRFEEESRLGNDEQIDKWMKSLWDLEEDRRKDMKTREELQHEVDILQGKAVREDATATANYDLPPEFAGSSQRSAPPKTAPRQPTHEHSFSQNSVSQSSVKSSEPSVPNLDESLVEDDWARRLKEAINSPDDEQY